MPVSSMRSGFFKSDVKKIMNSLKVYYEDTDAAG